MPLFALGFEPADGGASCFSGLWSS